jgi:hypothetical protein
VDIVALGQAFLLIFRFPPVCVVTTSASYVHLHVAVTRRINRRRLRTLQSNVFLGYRGAQDRRFFYSFLEIKRGYEAQEGLNNKTD